MSFAFDCQAEGASEEELEELQELCEGILPDEYLSLLAYSNGGEWSLPVMPHCFVLFEVKTVIGNLVGTDFTEVFPNCVPIGGDGMTDYVALRFRGEKIDIVGIDATEDDVDTATYPIASSFADLMAMVGREAN